MDTPTTETPAAAPELSLADIITSELAAADATGTPVAQGEVPDEGAKPSTEAKPEEKPAEAAPTADAETPAAEPETTEEKPADDISARRVRTMLAEIDARTKALEDREANMGRSFLEQLFKSPKATLAKFGKSVDDIIDSSISEGNEPAEAKPEDRLTALEKRIADREAAEQRAAEQRMIDDRKAEITRSIKAAGAKYPVLTAAGRESDVVDYMIEYHAVHGQPISWERAAATVEKDLTGLGIATAKKLGWSAPAAKPAAAPAKERPGTTSIGGDQRTAAPPTTDGEPEDPNKLMAYLAAQYGVV